MGNAGWMTHKTEVRLQLEISSTSDSRWYHFNGRKWRGTKEPLDSGETGDRKRWLNVQQSKSRNHGIQSHHFIANREKVETVSNFIFLGSKITANGDSSHEIRKHLLLGRKAMTKLDSILKSRDINSPTKVHIVKAMVFPVVMYGCESWTIKKAKHWRIDAFELWCWRRLLRVPGTARKSNWSILKEINTEYSLEGLMLKQKFQYFGHLMQRANPDAGKDWRPEEKGTTEDKMVGWHHQLNGPEFEQAPGDGQGQGSLACCSPWGYKESDMTEWLNNNKNWKSSR